MTRRVLVAMLTAASLSSCSWFVGPDDDLSAEVTFDVSPDAGQDLADSASISVDGKDIVITGVITTSDGCREVNGAGEVSSNSIRIVIRADVVGEGCPTVLGRYDYQVVLANMKSGLWNVEVRHRLRGDGASTFVAGKPTLVP
ncbi:MAG TPA: hypothetical protein VJR92_10850 [Gemmatimonadaceae bacterium]|nr:hypothetical protein [Gemmatimonadaceae bacterium]